MSIAAKLLTAAEACSYVQKDGNNAFHKYRFASAANILGHVNDALTRAGLAVVETLPEVVSVDGAGKERVVTARMTITVADTESEERATFRGLGSGMDSGDKAIMKAVTAATKYAWMGAFSISTGDDPEADEETDARTRTSSAAPTSSKPRQTPQTPRQSPAPAPPPPAVTREPGSDDDAPLPPALEAFYARVAEVELPGEAVAVWMRHRTDLASLPVLDREAAWKALCRRTEEVGKMKQAKVWLKKAIAEEDARRAADGARAESGAA